MIAVSIIAVKLSNTTRRMILLGPLSYQPRGNLPLSTVMYYKAEYSSYQGNSGFRVGMGRDIIPPPPQGCERLKELVLKLFCI